VTAGAGSVGGKATDARPENRVASGAPGPRPFPLVPRWRVAGIPFGEQRSVRRGPGSDVAGSRAYRPDDPVGAIDWRASARLSSARGADEFVVREFQAEEAPRVVVVCDRRPSMALYPPPLPWLSKPQATTAVADAIAVSALAARGEVGYLDLAEGGAPFWLPPRSRGPRADIAARLEEAPFDAAPESLEDGLAHLARLRSELPSGSFVFVVSDFIAPVALETWLRTLALRWDLVPVVVQDPTWEQSFPELPGVVVPFAEPGANATTLVRVTPRDASELRRAHQARLATRVSDFRGLGLDPVVVGTSDALEIDHAFLVWAELRRQGRRRSR
jgi:uncharacterized protein (DUF58 family)